MDAKMTRALRMKHGFYCSLSLRACTIVLACINLLISLYGIRCSELIVYGGLFHPEDLIRDDFDLEHEGTTATNHSQNVPTTTVPTTTTTEEPLPDEYRIYVVVSFIFDGLNLILATFDVLASAVLIFGAARMSSIFIRPWLFVGVTMVGYDIIYFIVHTAIGVHFSYSSNALFHIPLVAYLLAVAWNLWQECRDAETHAARARVAALTKGQDEAACTLSYNVLSEA